MSNAEIIQQLKAAKAERGLSISQIMSMLDKAGNYLSESTVKRVFRHDSESRNFDYQFTLLPLVGILLDDQIQTESLVSKCDRLESEIVFLKMQIERKDAIIESLMFMLTAERKG